MSWLSGILPSSTSKPTSNSQNPAPTALQQQRRKQIDSLRKFHHTVTEVQRDVEYKITFSAGSSSMALNVMLPPQFPNEKPVVTVSPPCCHPWINEQMVVVGCPSLNMFYMHSNLGKALQDVVRELCEHPPGQTASQVPSQVSSQSSSSSYSPLVPYAGYTPPYTPLSAPSAGNSTSSNPMTRISFSSGDASSQRDGPSPSWQTSSSSNRTQPTVSRPCSFPELGNMSLEDLKQLHEDPEVCIKFISKFDEVKDLRTKREELMKLNEDIAKSNISALPQMEALKDAIINKYGELSGLKQEFDVLSQKQQELMENYSFEAVHTNFQVDATKADAESEELAEEFLEGKLSIEKFLPKFREKRKLYHSRTAKEEKMHNLSSSF